jgi:ribonuclease P protein component
VKKRSKASRISKRSQILFLLKNGKRWKSAPYSIVYLENSSDLDRSAVIVSKANGNAVTRNRIKRVYRNLFFRNKSAVPPFFDVLIVPAGSCLPPVEELQSNFEKWKKSLKE